VLYWTDVNEDKRQSVPEGRGLSKEKLEHKQHDSGLMRGLKIGGLVIGATALSVATVAEDVGTGGGGLIDDPVTLGASATMLRQAWALAA
jgi:hypothetical protein